MKLELADGRIITDLGKSTIESAIDSLNSTNDFAILGSDDYIQTAVTTNGFLAEYQDSDGHLKSIDEGLSIELIKEVFVLYFEENSSWKSKIVWEHAEQYEENSGKAANSTNSPNPGDNFVEEIKRKGLNWIKKKLKNII